MYVYLLERQPPSAAGLACSPIPVHDSSLNCVLSTLPLITLALAYCLDHELLQMEPSLYDMN